jgi:hypothetical protein
MSLPSPKRRWTPRLALACCLLAPLPAAAAPVPPRPETPVVPDPTSAAIDELLARSWQEGDDLKPVGRTDDHAFLRRVTLDLAGRIATPDELRAFTADRRADRRLRAIDRLLRSDECNTFWAERMTDELLPPWTDAAWRERFVGMMRDHLARGGSYRDLVKRLLTATGRPAEEPAVIFSLALLGREHPKNRWADDGRFDTIPLVEKVGRNFLAVDLHCIRCHDHPFDPALKQVNFWGMIGFFRQLDRVTEKPGDVLLRDNPGFNANGALFYEKRNGLVLVRRVSFLDGTRLAPEEKNRREVLADHVTRHDNFAKAFVNRTWAHLLGHGLNQQPPWDDLNENNPFVHPELADRLARDFAASGYDPKKLMRWICASEAYQRCSAGVLPADVLFLRAGWRPLTARQRLNATLTALRAEVTLTAKERRTLRDDWLAAQPIAPQNCEAHLVPADCPPDSPGDLDALRVLLASPEIRTALEHPEGTVALAMKDKTPASVLDELFLTAFNRYPTVRESETLLKQLAEPGRRQVSAAAWQDLFWTMLCSTEFLGNR